MPNNNFRLVHPSSKTTIASDLRIANNFFSRLKGLMFSKMLPMDSGLLIQPCQQIHTHFMRYPIDVIFADKQLNVVHIIPTMQPWRFSKYIKQSHCVIELPAGSAEKIKLGDALSIEAKSS